ncbi:helix-turn-helix domain-containing protein [Kitasatospora azatica]|uniref:helix-turn-helix domain-containing protein n=1 Tax=Kitasatospora azatica TaxID=58347 RepID=UPI00068FBE35|nr:helix-turn-helix domain-containing protein [Kitasatospora azatica]
MGQHSELDQYARRLDDLLGQLRVQSGRPEGPDRVVSWLARALDADLRLTLTAAADTDVDAAADVAADGQAAPPEVELPEVELPAAQRLFPIGRPARAVLALRRPAPLSVAEARLVGHAETVLDRLLEARESAAERARLREVSASLRVAAFQLLMGGQTTLARRTAAPLAPGVLTLDTARIYLVDCAGSDRDETAQLLGEVLAGSALVIRCPAHETQLIVLTPLGPRTPLDESGWCPTGLALRRALVDRLDHHLGGSTTVELSRTADAYREAYNALAVARRLPQRYALYQEQTPLAQLLEDPARGWAEELLQPVLALPREQREEVIETTRLALAFSHAQTGRMLDVHRNTVARRIERGVKALGLDWGSFRDRALLDLALQLLARPPAAATPVPAGSAPPPPPPLAAVLGGEAARAWAQAFLAPLAEDRRPLLRTLAGWVTAGANARDTRAALGLHHQTVLDHLRTAERLLQRELTAGRSGAYELAWALWISGAATASTG